MAGTGAARRQCCHLLADLGFRQRWLEATGRRPSSEAAILERLSGRWRGALEPRLRAMARAEAARLRREDADAELVHELVACGVGFIGVATRQRVLDGARQRAGRARESPAARESASAAPQALQAVREMGKAWLLDRAYCGCCRAGKELGVVELGGSGSASVHGAGATVCPHLKLLLQIN